MRGEGVRELRRLRPEDVEPESCPRCHVRMELVKTRLRSASFRCPKCKEEHVFVYPPVWKE